VEFIERLSLETYGEDWLVRVGDERRVACVIACDDDERYRAIADGTRPWLGFRHPRVVPIAAMTGGRDQLVIVTGDERGQPFLLASKQLADPWQRERWAVVELCAIADAIAAMAEHVPGFVHQRAGADAIVVCADGVARLRAPIAWLSLGPRPGFLGRARTVPDLRWMSPEAVRGDKLAPASDVYQLAFALYTALHGGHPFARNGDFEMLRAILETPLPPVACSILGVAAVLERALAKDPAARHATVRDLATALRRCAPVDDVADAHRKLAAPARTPPKRLEVIAGMRCDRRWDELAPTTIDGVRHCASCALEVVEVRSIEALVPLLGKRCVRTTSESD
jgi:hypothetical protein